VTILFRSMLKRARRELRTAAFSAAENELAAAEVDGTAHESVDDFHDRDLNGLLVFEQRNVVEAPARKRDALKHALVEVTELLIAESG
jgi:hypothetical protein